MLKPPSKCIDEGEEEAKMIIVFRVPWKLHGGSGDVAEIVVGNELVVCFIYEIELSFYFFKRIRKTFNISNAMHIVCFMLMI